MLLVLLAVLLPAPHAAADCVVNTPDSRCTTPGYPPGDCVVNAFDSDCREGGSCTVNVLSASCFSPYGTCAVNMGSGFCQGDCMINAGWCDATAGACVVNLRYCGSTANCSVNAGLCDHGADCLISLGWCGAGGECAVNIASPLAPTPAESPDCWGSCTVNYGDACRATRCDDALVSLREGLIVEDLELCF